jgi:hypothetical protein
MFESGVSQLRTVCINFYVTTLLPCSLIYACVTIAYLLPVSENLNFYVHSLPCVQHLL